MTRLDNRLKANVIIAFYYNGDHEGRSTETGWWLAYVTSVKRKVEGCTVNMYFLSEPSVVCVFDIKQDGYVETIDGTVGYEFASWSFDITSSALRDKPDSKPKKTTQTKLKPKKTTQTKLKPKKTTQTKRIAAPVADAVAAAPVADAVAAAPVADAIAAAPVADAVAAAPVADAVAAAPVADAVAAAPVVDAAYLNATMNKLIDISDRVEQNSRQDRNLVLNYLTNERTNKPRCGGNTSRRSCAFYHASNINNQCKSAKSTAQEAKYINMDTINTARNEIVKKEIPVFKFSDNKKGFNINELHTLSKMGICTTCNSNMPMKHAINIAQSTPTNNCIICMNSMGIVAASWSINGILCKYCSMQSTKEEDIKKILQRMINTLNSTVLKSYKQELEIEIESDEIDKIKLDVFITSKNRGNVSSVIVIEIDANSHVSNQYKKEHERNMRIVNALRRGQYSNVPILFIRFDPNSEIELDDGDKYKFSLLHRILVLESWILAIALDPERFPKHLLMLYLFYSRSSPRLWLPESDDEGARVNRICVTHRAVVPAVSTEKVSWRYFLNPAVHFQLIKARKDQLIATNPYNIDACENLGTKNSFFKRKVSDI